tara:strand:+ start:345 stop:671 length:327 start_codon:yes stop_codon:yes gene_type:complete
MLQKTDEQLLDIIEYFTLEVCPEESYIELELEEVVNGEAYMVLIDADISTNCSLDTPETMDWPAETSISLNDLEINSIVLALDDEEIILDGQLLEDAKQHFINTLIYI